MSSPSFNDSLDQLGGDSVTAPNQPIEDGYVGVDESPIYGTEDSNEFTSHPISNSPSQAPIYVSGADQRELSSLNSGENGTPFEGEYAAADGPVLPPLSEMQPEEGLALEEWRRLNALRLEEKEKIEKELVSQILDEADEYKTNFHNKRKVTCENNKATNREREKVYLAGRDKFHADADKSYWKAIAELIPNEVPVIEKRGKKDEDKKPSIFVIQGPKPGKPTDLSRMRQILIKLKHNTPLHLKQSPPPVKVDAAAAATTTTTTAPPAAVASSTEAVAVA